MKKILIIAVLAAIAVSPTYAGYVYGVPVNVNWTDNFDDGDISDYTTIYGAMGVVSPEPPQNTAGAKKPVGTYSLEQPSGSVNRTDMVMKNLKAGWPGYNGNSALSGYAFTWFYDDMTGSKDARFGLISSAYASGSGVANSTTINLSTAGSGSTVYYRVQWSWSAYHADGVANGGSSTNFGWTTGVAATRYLGWHRAKITYNYDWDIGRADIAWYVDNMVSPVHSLWYNSTHSRYVATKDVARLQFGSYLAHTGAFYFDDAKMNTTLLTPEPSSLLALGIGLIGLAGFARRRK